MKYMFFALFIIFLILFIKYFYKQLLLKRIKSNLEDYLRKHNKKFTIINPNNSGCDLLIETNDEIFICKIFITNKADNLIITNPTTWILAKKSEPILIDNRLKNVNDFYNYKPSSKKACHKIAILYPGIKQIRKYINENEMIIINLNEEIDGYRFITYNNLNLFK